MHWKENDSTTVYFFANRRFKLVICDSEWAQLLLIAITMDLLCPSKSEWQWACLHHIMTLKLEPLNGVQPPVILTSVLFLLWHAKRPVVHLSTSLTGTETRRIHRAWDEDEVEKITCVTLINPLLHYFVISLRRVSRVEKLIKGAALN